MYLKADFNLHFLLPIRAFAQLHVVYQLQQDVLIILHVDYCSVFYMGFEGYLEAFAGAACNALNIYGVPRFTYVTITTERTVLPASQLLYVIQGIVFHF